MLNTDNPINKDAEKYLFEGPIAGQSLTNSPENPYPWEKNPEITSVKEATEKIFFDLLKEDNIITVSKLMSQKKPVLDIANLLLTAGFQKGKWNPDLMVNLVEPTMYMLMAIAEKVGIDPVLTREDNDVMIDDDDEQNNLQDLKEGSRLQNSMGSGGRLKDLVINKINPASVGSNIKEQLDTLDTSKLKESILQKPKPSLLGKTGV
tara:strand:- start:415 stop:1032 length:618 start_codon:yes stop_codon:yes gene_type:complete